MCGSTGFFASTRTCKAKVRPVPSRHNYRAAFTALEPALVFPSVVHRLREPFVARSVMSKSSLANVGRSEFRPDVEGLRAVAILLVVAFHVGIPGLSGGFIGVDVFFVISGYLITALLVREIDELGTLRLANFYARRVRRLLPASAVMILVIVLAGELLLSPLERMEQTRAALAAAAYVSNFWFLKQGSDYFAADSTHNPFLHTWSLAVEEQFYLVWPLLIVLAYRLFRSKKALAFVMLLVSCASFALCIFLGTANQPAAFFSSPTRAWEFGIGGIASLLPPAIVSASRPWQGRTALAGMLGVLAGAALIDSDMRFPSSITLLPVIGTSLVLFSGASTPRGIVSTTLARQSMQQIGRLSYSWYLWHWPVLLLGVALFPGLNLLGRATLASAALGVAALSHRFVENPIRFNRHLVVRPWASLALGAGITTLTLGMTRTAKLSATSAANAPEQRAIAEAADGSQELSRSRCLVDYNVVQPPPCEFGDTRSATTIALFGDSHAAQWFSALLAIARERHWRLVVLTKQGCPSASVTIEMWTRNQPYPQCSQWREAAIQRIEAIRPALVVVANSDAHVTWPNGKGGVRLTAEAWRNGSRITFLKLNAAGIPTLAIRDTPGMGMDVLQCLSRSIGRARGGAECKAQQRDAVREDVYLATKEAAAGLPLVSLIDVTPYFCDGRICPVMREGSILFRDAGHISDQYARKLSGVIEAYVAPLIVAMRPAN